MGRRAHPLPLLLAMLAFAACGAPRPASRPNLLLVTLDTTRADHTSLSGYARDTTPQLADLADAGASLAAAYAPSPSTAPSHASLFTGLAPLSHGLLKNTLALPASRETLAVRLRAEGYATAAIVSSFVLHSRFGLARGFESYSDRFSPEQATLRLERWEGIALDGAFDRRADHTTDLALAWLRTRDAARPFFLFVHYFDPHLPYTPPPAFAGRFADGTEAGGVPAGGAAGADVQAAIDRYDAELAFTDAELGRLLAGLEAEGLAADTLVVVVGDHGEGLMDHGHMEHGIHLYEEALRVPWVWRWPGVVAAGAVLEDPVWLPDFAPTAAALLGVEAMPGQGRDLSAWLRGEAEGPGPERALFLQTDRPASLRRLRGLRGAQWALGEMFGVREGPWKYLEDARSGPVALHRLDRDPEERVDLRAAEPERAAALAARLAAWKREHRRPEPPAPDLSPREREALRALGYLE